MRLWELMEMKPRKLLTGELRIPEKVEVVPAGYVRQKLQNKTVYPTKEENVVKYDRYVGGVIAQIEAYDVAANVEIPWGTTLEDGASYNIVGYLNQDQDSEFDEDFVLENGASVIEDPHGLRINLTRTGISVDRGPSDVEVTLNGWVPSGYTGLESVTVKPIPSDYVKMPAGYASASKVIFTKKSNGTWTGAIAND